MTEQSQNKHTLGDVLREHDARPSDAFYRRMEQAPWTQKQSNPLMAWINSTFGLRTFSMGMATVFALLVVGSSTAVFMSSRGGSNMFTTQSGGASAPTAAFESKAAADMAMSFTGTYSAELPAASSPGRLLSVTLNDDGTVRWVTDYKNNRPAIVETGTWTTTPNGRVTVALTGTAAQGVQGAPAPAPAAAPSAERAYVRPNIIEFEVRTNALVAVEWDRSVYGSNGIQVWRSQP